MIRKATPKDMPYILEMYKSAMIELGEEYEESYLLKKIVNSYHLAPCFLLVIDDRICGMAGLTSVTMPNTGKAMLSDYVFYVDDDYRSLPNLSELVDSAKAFAKKHNLPLRLDFVVNGDQKIRERLLEMHGFEVKSIVGVYYG